MDDYVKARGREIERYIKTWPQYDFLKDDLLRFLLRTFADWGRAYEREQIAKSEADAKQKMVT